MQSIKDCWRQQEALLSEHIEQLEEQIEALIRQDDYLAQTYQRMLTAPGIGQVIGTVWVSRFAGQAELDPRKIASRFGFAPHPSTSGSSTHKRSRSSGFGNGYMRRLMHQAARSVSTHRPHYQKYYQRKLGEGKPELVAINNIINKLIRLYCAMWNRQTEYDPEHVQKMTKRRKNVA